MPDTSPAIRSGSIMQRAPDGAWKAVRDEVCTEEPLEIRLGNKPLVVTMRTPGNDRELAAGYLLTEGIVDHRDQILNIEPCPLPASMGNVINVSLDPEREAAGLKNLGNRRSAIAASCGVCGKRTIQEALALRGKPVETSTTFAESTLLSLPESLRQSQATFSATGGLHAAGLFTPDGTLLAIHEDVGRHNAVDKAIGHAFLDQHPTPDLLLMVSGRVSFEIVQKALAANIPLIAAVSAPSSLAIQCARESGITLLGFLRPPRMNLYSHPQRIAFTPPSP